MTLGLSAADRSHIVSASYIVRPVKRLPSKPWSGWPRVRGISAAVMPIRSTDSAEARCGSPTTSAVASIHAVRAFFELTIRICSNPFSLR